MSYVDRSVGVGEGAYQIGHSSNLVAAGYSGTDSILKDQGTFIFNYIDLPALQIWHSFEEHRGIEAMQGSIKIVF